MAFSIQNQQLFFLLALLLPIAINGDDFITQQCGKNFTNNPLLEGNINSVVLDLMSNTSAYGFASSFHGADNDTVYGISECRGDANEAACAACINDAAHQLHTSCPNSADSRIWYQSCFLRYDTDNFIGKPDWTKVGYWFSGNKPKDPQAYSKTVNELLSLVGLAASYGERKFGSGQIQNPNSTDSDVTTYGMAQCTSDLQQFECIECLGVALNMTVATCSGVMGCYTITTSCAVRYETYQFLFTSAPLDPATPARSISITNF